MGKLLASFALTIRLHKASIENFKCKTIHYLIVWKSIQSWNITAILREARV